jgi:endonuclease/exonuclease/phosphatase family metal-dependent hydrolase
MGLRIALLAAVFLFSFQAFPFCLQSFNGYGPAYAFHVAERTALFTREIKTQGCEVVHLQEIWSKNQIEIVKGRLKSDYAIFSPNETNRIGVMSFSKFPVMHTEFHIFSFNSDGGILDGGRDLFGVEKGFAIQNLKLTNSQNIDFINLHLHPASEAVRLAQIYEIIQWRLSKTTVAPVLLSGDFNMTPTSLEHQLLLGALGLKDSVLEKWGKYPEHFCTYCSTQNRLSWLRDDRVFDYVLFSNKALLKVTDVVVDLKGTPENRLSDHFGLRVNFDLSESLTTTRNIEHDRQALIYALSQAMVSVSQEYTVSSRIYNDMGLWRQELMREQGPFWDYFKEL